MHFFAFFSRLTSLRFPSLSRTCIADPDETFSTKDSPKAPHAIDFKGYFTTDDWNILCLGLSYEHTVKWILVRAGQESGSNAMLCRNS